MSDRSKENPIITTLRDDNDGKLPTYSDFGVYPLYYLDHDGNVLCPSCANEDCDCALSEVDTNWEDPDLHCDDCGARIESAYAEPEEQP